MVRASGLYTGRYDSTHLKVKPKPSGTENAVEDEAWVHHSGVPDQAPSCCITGPDTYCDTAGDTKEKEHCKVTTKAAPLVKGNQSEGASA